MRLPRLNLRTLMIVVDVLAMVLAVEMTDWAYANQRKKAATCDLMKARYERAAYHFWEPVPAEPTRE